MRESFTVAAGSKLFCNNFMPSQSPDEVHSSLTETVFLCEWMSVQDPQGNNYSLLMLEYIKSSTFMVFS